MHTYPKADELNSMGATLLRDVVLWTPRLAREYTTNGYAAANVPLTLTREPKRVVAWPRKHIKRQETL